MISWFGDLVGEAKKDEGWDVEKRDARTVLFLFGPVQYLRTLMTDQEGTSHYPLDERLASSRISGTSL
ncbi:hypothetical protein [Salibacterium qingdaonense]|uniref:hypothetical protein n=1 Tax=Salibacterium qingdaonense TaxID=266892 RepID=UPI000B803BFF|nr:hypothetical protein [Salibacterium qingdaonense]